MKALIIDDDKNILKLLNRFCEKVNLETILCDSYQKATQVIDDKNTTYRLAIVDMNISKKLDGVNVVKHIRQNEYYIPIITISGSGNIEYLDKSIFAGTDKYLQKPFGFDDFKKALSEITSNSLLKITKDSTEIYNLLKQDSNLNQLKPYLDNRIEFYKSKINEKIDDANILLTSKKILEYFYLRQKYVNLQDDNLKQKMMVADGLVFLKMLSEFPKLYSNIVKTSNNYPEKAFKELYSKFSINN